MLRLAVVDIVIVSEPCYMHITVALTLCRYLVVNEITSIHRGDIPELPVARMPALGAKRTLHNERRVAEEAACSLLSGRKKKERTPPEKGVP